MAALPFDSGEPARVGVGHLVTAGSVGRDQPVRFGIDSAENEQRPATGPSWRRADALTVLSVVAVALFALWGIGGPLIGRSVLASTDEMTLQGSYLQSGLGERTENTTLDDTYTSRLPGIIVYKESLWHGAAAQ
jgi:hypothetical protein